jgi:CheY-like chemotaxis protein
MGAGPVTRPTILVVDDHSGFRATARRLLERDGWSVVGEAEDGRDALAATAALEPDVVLLDIGLPDIDGFDVAERIAQIGDAPSIVLISSRDQEAYHDRVQGVRLQASSPRTSLTAWPSACCLQARDRDHDASPRGPGGDRSDRARLRTVRNLPADADRGT